MFNKSLSELKEMGAEITTGEIKQQPELWEETLQIFQTNETKIKTFLEKVKATTDEKIRVIFTGAGTSQYVGDTITPYLNQHGDNQSFVFESIGTTSIVSTPLDYFRPNETTILVSFARSGNSPESVATVDLANQLIKNIYHITITCAKDGQLALAAKGDADNLLLLMPEASNDKGFTMTGSFSCMSLTGLLVFDLATTETKAKWGQSIINMGHEVIQREAEIAEYLAGEYNRIVYLGSGSLSGLAREAQLKVLELTAGKITTAFDSSLGFRHGPKSFVDEKTLVFVFTSNDVYTRQYDVEILEEINGDHIAEKVVGIDQQVSAGMSFSGDRFTFKEIELLPEAYLALPSVMFAQTVSLYSSIKVGNTPDTPSPTGTVNRVVKGVTIHKF